MAVSLQVGIKQTQKLVMTQSLRQAIELLQLSTVELHDKILAELQENPVLEEDEQAVQPPGTDDEDLTSRINQNLSGDEGALPAPDELYGAVSDVSDSGNINSEDAIRRREFLESCITHRETLAEHLLWQARMTARDNEEYDTFEKIITALDENGFLTADLSSLIDSSVDSEKLEGIRAAINGFDPVGCGAFSVTESLLVQARHYFPDDTVLHRIIADHMENLENLDYETIARACSISTRDVIEKNRVIQNLDPWPGRQYSRAEARYIIPDIEVQLVDDRIIVTQRDEWLPRLRLSGYYTNLIRKKNIEKNARDYIQDKIQSARYLLKNISSRRETIQRVVESVMEKQSDFLRKGPGNLKPLTHMDISREIGMSESTVSRATAGKYVQTSWGVFELKYFFVSRLKSSGRGGDHSSDQVIAMIRHIVDHEEPGTPLSDDEIVNLLGKNGVTIARRTVAKYRGICNIPPSSKRKKINQLNNKEQP